MCLQDSDWKKKKYNDILKPKIASLFSLTSIGTNNKQWRNFTFIKKIGEFLNMYLVWDLPFLANNKINIKVAVWDNFEQVDWKNY